MDLEVELLRSVVAKSTDFASAGDAFLSGVLAEVGYQGRPTDGVLFSLDCCQPRLESCFGSMGSRVRDGRVDRRWS